MQRVLPAILLVCCGSDLLPAATIFVDNGNGSDGYDGLDAEPTGSRTGPVRTLLAGVRLCRPGDRLVIVNTGSPYFGSLQLSGERHSGNPVRNFEVIGNGATILGLRAVPSSAWRYVGDDVWSLNLFRKGNVLLLVNGEVVPRHEPPNGALNPKAIPVGSFALHEGLVHFKGDRTRRPPDMDFAFAAEDTGLTLYKVHDVTIRDLNFAYFRIDGISAADSARRITLENVTSMANGRAGVTLKGVSTIRARGGETRGNMVQSVRIEGPAAIEVDGFEFDVEPTVVE